MTDSQPMPMEPYQIENLKRREQRKNTKVTVTLGFLDEVEELLSVAHYAMCKMGMRNDGANCRYAHEVRMLAWHFSDKDTSKPEGCMTDGGGTYQDVRQKFRELQP